MPKTVITPHQKSLESLLSHFGFSANSAIPLPILQSIMNVVGMLSSHTINHETALAIVKSYEMKQGKLDDAHLRVDRFHNFVKSLHESSSDKQPFLDSVKNLGMLSKVDLEETAKETGDWSHFLKRVDSEKSQQATQEVVK